jgi:hypothetical protein
VDAVTRAVQARPLPEPSEQRVSLSAHRTHIERWLQHDGLKLSKVHVLLNTCLLSIAAPCTWMIDDRIWTTPENARSACTNAVPPSMPWRARSDRWLPASLARGRVVRNAQRSFHRRSTNGGIGASLRALRALSVREAAGVQARVAPTYGHRLVVPPNHAICVDAGRPGLFVSGVQEPLSFGVPGAALAAIGRGR